MKRLHKKIGVGVLVSGLLIGGVSFPSGSVSYANSKNNDSSLFVNIGSVLSELNIPLPDILKIFEEGGFRGILEDDYNKSGLPSILKQNAGNEEDFYNSIHRLGSYGNYAVIGFNLKGKNHSIDSKYDKYWYLKVLDIDYNKFSKYSRGRFDEKGKDKFNELNLKSGNIYRVRFENKHQFLIVVFDKDGL